MNYENITMDSAGAYNYFLNKVSYTLGPMELTKLIEKDPDGFNLFDVRLEEDYFKGHIPMAISLPAAHLEDKLCELSIDKPNIVYCYNQNCHLGAKCALIIAKNEFPVMELDGGFEYYKEKGFEVVK